MNRTQRILMLALMTASLVLATSPSASAAMCNTGNAPGGVVFGGFADGDEIHIYVAGKGVNCYHANYRDRVVTTLGDLLS